MATVDDRLTNLQQRFAHLAQLLEFVLEELEDGRQKFGTQPDSIITQAMYRACRELGVSAWTDPPRIREMLMPVDLSPSGKLTFIVLGNDLLWRFVTFYLHRAQQTSLEDLDDFRLLTAGFAVPAVVHAGILDGVRVDLRVLPVSILDTVAVRAAVLDAGDNRECLKRCVISEQVLRFLPGQCEGKIAASVELADHPDERYHHLIDDLFNTTDAAMEPALVDPRQNRTPAAAAAPPSDRPVQPTPETPKTVNYRLRRLGWDGYLVQLLLLLGIDKAVAQHRVENAVSLLDGALSIDHQRRSSELLATDAHQLEEIGKHLVGTDRIYHKVWYEIGQAALAWRKDADALDYRQVNEKVTRWCGQLGLTYVSGNFFQLFCEEASTPRRF